MRVGLAFNLIKKEMLVGKPIDIIAEYDSEQTINALKSAIESGGHEVVLIEADEKFAEILAETKPDIVFNIAEGKIGTESRESYIPLICETLGVPYTGSGPLTLAICLDKIRTKEILLAHGIPTPKYQIFQNGNEKLKLNFPLIVKLSREGSAMGLDYDSVVTVEEQLRKKVSYLMKNYDQKILVEKYLPGEEFTVPIVGNESPVVLPVVKSVYNGLPPLKRINLFTIDRPVVSLINEAAESKFRIYQRGQKAECPAEIDSTMKSKLEETALKTYEVLECRDWCRMEIRLDEDSIPNVLEVNPIPGIDPTYWFAHSAYAAGMTYEQLINKILDFAIERYKKKGLL